MRFFVFASLFLLFISQTIFAQRRQQQRNQQQNANGGDLFSSSVEMEEANGNGNNDEQFHEESHLKRNLELWIRRRHQKREIGEEEEADLEGQTCKIKVQKVETVKGKCVKLRGGMRGCQTDKYLDPVNEDCGELD